MSIEKNCKIKSTLKKPANIAAEKYTQLDEYSPRVQSLSKLKLTGYGLWLFQQPGPTKGKTTRCAETANLIASLSKLTRFGYEC
ncbi:hypothetical protein ACB092_06G041300 [Castanea dentata]